MSALGLLALVASAAVGCADAPPRAAGGEPSSDTGQVDDENITDLVAADFNILFVGNSLTYTNDLPSLVKERMEARGHQVGIRTIAHPSYALVDHWRDGVVQRRIASGLFDFVVVQQGPSSQPYGSGLLLKYGVKLKTLCDEYGASLAFFMVWPSRQHYYTFNGVIASYSDAAAATDSLLCPVGLVWKQHFDETGCFDYYGPDGFHPSEDGSAVAADVIVDSLLK